MEVNEVHGLVPQDRLDPLQQALAVAGIDHAGIEVRPAPRGRYQLHDETLHRDAAGARHGLLAGAVVGALIGLVVGLLVPQITGALATVTTAFGVAGFGALVGAVVGLQRADGLDGDPVGYHQVTDEVPFSLLTVHDEHWHYRAHRIMEQHGAVFVETPQATVDTA